MTEDEPLKPLSPYGRSKLMVEWMLEDVAKAYDFNYVALRYFNVAGGDPKGRAGQSTPNATHLIKVAAQAALGLRPRMQLSARIIRRRTEPVCAITFMFRISPARIWTRYAICAAAAQPRL